MNTAHGKRLAKRIAKRMRQYWPDEYERLLFTAVLVFAGFRIAEEVA